MKYIAPKGIRQLFSLSLILLLGGLIFIGVVPYISGILGAITLYVLLRNWMHRLMRRGINRIWAAIFLVVISFIGIMIPIVGIVTMFGGQIGNLADKSESVVIALQEQVFILEKYIDYDLASRIDPSGASEWITESLPSLAGGTFNILISIAIMYFLLFYMLISPKVLRESVTDYLPIRKENLGIIRRESQAMVISNAIGIPMVAVAQGIVALIGFLIFGIENPMFWFVVVSLGSMVPFVGTFLGILPVFILSLASGNDFQAWGILIYGIVVVGTSDNLIRLLVLKKLDNVHPLITLIGVVIGIPLFGFIGIIFGPLLLSLFFVMVRMYKIEYGIQDNRTH
jgi:predicted PurR-regulated permease PerM